MTSALFAICFAANDPHRLAHFWAGVLDRQMTDDRRGGVTLPPSHDPGFRIRFVSSQEPKVGQNRMHFELTSRWWEEQRQTVARALGLGGRHIDVGQLPEEEHVVLADPEGNEFCVIEPGNTFLAGCGFVGALACDGSQAVGYFWSEALHWPLVWDQDQETAIQAPEGGPKLTWGGPPLMPRTGKDRLRFDLAPFPDADRDAEIARLLGLGATCIDGGRDGSDPLLMADPDGNEFCLLTSR